jgi:hypothetical protein
LAIVAEERRPNEEALTEDLHGLRQLAVDHPEVKSRIVVSLEPKARVTDDGISILPWKSFVHRLWQGLLF